MFLSGLYEVNGRCEKKMVVSGLFLSSLRLLRLKFFKSKIVG